MVWAAKNKANLFSPQIYLGVEKAIWKKQSQFVPALIYVQP
jgi:hypothetical protein